MRTAVRSALDGGPLARAIRSSVTSVSPTSPPASTNAGASTTPIGTSRIAPSAASAAAPGRISASIGTPALWPRRIGLADDLQRAENHAASSTIAIGQTKPSGANRDSAMITPTAIARSRAPLSPFTAGMVRVASAIGAGPVGRQPAASTAASGSRARP